MITAATTLAAVIGHPVRHSLSPVLHHAGFASLDVDWAYVAFDVAPGDADQALQAMACLSIGGLSVTMPHKTQVADCVGRLDPAAAALRSANTVSRDPDGTLVGHSTDGDGLVGALATEGISVAGAACCVIGAGGAGRSIIDALARHGAGGIAVINRDRQRAVQAASLAPGLATVAESSSEAIGNATLVINATSVGMAGTDVDRLPLDPADLHRGQTVVDIVYQPRQTALLRAAKVAGARPIDGLGMLVHQAALQQQLWIGVLPDVVAMRAAAEVELARRANNTAG